jgi:hypothetical protein
MAKPFPEVDWSAIESRYLTLLRDRDPEEFRKMYLGDWTTNPHIPEHHVVSVKPCARKWDFTMPPLEEIARHHDVSPTGRWMNPHEKLKLGNPCSEIIANPPTIEGHKIHRRHLVSLTYDEDDGTMYFEQKACSTNPEISFGPLTCSLSRLMNQEHYWLDAQVSRRARDWRSPAKARIYLTNGIVRYKVATADWDDIQSVARIGGGYDLADHINNGLNLVRACSSMPIIQEVHVVDERDPFDVITERYKKPKRAKNPDVPLPGTNHTLKEEVRYQLTGKTPDQL